VLICNNYVYKGVTNTYNAEVLITIYIKTRCEDLIVHINTAKYKVSYLSPLRYKASTGQLVIAIRY